MVAVEFVELVFAVVAIVAVELVVEHTWKRKKSLKRILKNQLKITYTGRARPETLGTRTTG